MPFFTALDSRAEVKGSRDPLGFVPVWAKIGRRVVGNLTTVSNTVRGFTTLLMGYYLAELISDSRSSDDEAATRPLDVFLRFEQVAAYTRMHGSNDDDARILGERRVRRALSQSLKPPIGVSADALILSDQKTYGLWGLFSTPSRTSGLLQPGEPRLTPEGRDLVERLYLPRLRAGGPTLDRQLINLVRHDGRYYMDGRHRDLFVVLEGILSPRFTAPERHAYEEFLVLGTGNMRAHDPTRGEQARLSMLLRRLPQSESFGIRPLEQTIAAAQRTDGHERLADYLEDVLHTEQVIVPLQLAFLFALSRDGKPLAYVAAEISKQWGPLAYTNPDGFARVRSEMQSAYESSEAADRLIDAARALHEGDYEQVLRAMVAHNEFTMRQRNGSEPWVQLEGDTLDVRYRDETESLPERDKLPFLWRSTYFIDSLKSVINQLDAA
jgi:hypothetical protein